jgi:NAD-dependent deacetylase
VGVAGSLRRVKVVVLTGAGISAESGLPTFRDADGLWEGHDPMTVATPEAFEADPDLVHRFYDERRAVLSRVEPNAAHRALARLEEHLGEDLFLVTQNVDDLHERGGSRRVHHMHGRLRAARCTTCEQRHDWSGALGDRPPCPVCGRPTLRPDVVWFGEMPYDMDAVQEAIFDCDLFVAIGTAGLVYPAAAFVHYAIGNGADTLEMNLAPDPVSDFSAVRRGPATETVPAWVEEILR